MQACSILYKTRLPLLLVFNKTDVCEHDFALEWISSFEAFHKALDEESTYAASLSRSLSLVRLNRGVHLPSCGLILGCMLVKLTCCLFAVAFSKLCRILP